MEQRIKEIVSRFSKLRVDAFPINESSLNTKFKPKIVLKEKNEKSDKSVATGDLGDKKEENHYVSPKEVIKKPAKDQTPMMIKKINRHYQELNKNNLKKQKQPFIFHGSIDDYQKELEGRFGLENKHTEIDKSI